MHCHVIDSELRRQMESGDGSNKITTLAATSLTKQITWSLLSSNPRQEPTLSNDHDTTPVLPCCLPNCYKNKPTNNCCECGGVVGQSAFTVIPNFLRLVQTFLRTKRVMQADLSGLLAIISFFSKICRRQTMHRKKKEQQQANNPSSCL